VCVEACIVQPCGLTPCTPLARSFSPMPQVTPTASFSKDLGLDSLDQVEVCMALEEEFCVTIPDAEAEKILSNTDAISFICSHPQAK
jgi:acyl carrier protein